MIGSFLNVGHQLDPRLQKQYPGEEAVVVLEEVEEEKADEEAEREASDRDEAELAAGLLVLLLVLGAAVVRVRLGPPAVVLGKHLAQVEQVLGFPISHIN